MGSMKVTSFVRPLSILAVYLYFMNVVVQDLSDLDAHNGTGGRPAVFLESSSGAPIIATIVYMLMIFLGKILMKDREVIALKSDMVIYNLYQIVLNCYCVGATIRQIYLLNWPIWGTPTDVNDPAGFQLALLIWVHYQNKYVELLDTCFMVMKKNNHQISFLHTYHHVLLIWAWFFVCRLCACAGDAYFGATVNSFIHILMYTYYFCRLVGWKVPNFLKKNLTTAQMIQFAVCATHALWCLYNQYLVICAVIQLFVMINMLVLFSRFYKASYSKKKPLRVRGGSETGSRPRLKSK